MVKESVFTITSMFWKEYLSFTLQSIKMARSLLILRFYLYLVFLLALQRKYPEITSLCYWSFPMYSSATPYYMWPAQQTSYFWHKCRYIFRFLWVWQGILKVLVSFLQIWSKCCSTSVPTIFQLHYYWHWSCKLSNTVYQPMWTLIWELLCKHSSPSWKLRVTEHLSCANYWLNCFCSTVCVMLAWVDQIMI